MVVREDVRHSGCLFRACPGTRRMQALVDRRSGDYGSRGGRVTSSDAGSSSATRIGVA
jgi:hypothetical protein